MGHYDRFYGTLAISPTYSTVYQRAQEEGIDIPPEMFDFIEVMIHGAKKYEPNNWLKLDGINSDHKSMHASMFRHIASSSSGIRIDSDSGLDHLLNAACRCLMMYTRIKRGLE